MKVRAILKSLLFAYALTGVALLLLALVLFAFDLGETAVDAGIIIIYVLACFMGGFMGCYHRSGLLCITVDCLCYGKRRLGYECSSCSYNIFYVHRRWNTGWNAVVKKSF